MNGWLEVLASIANNLFQYIIIVSLTLFIYFWLLRKYVVDLFDPMLLSIVYSAFASSIIFYMYVENMIYSLDFFISFVFSELMYIVGFTRFKPLLLTMPTKTLKAVEAYQLHKNIAYYTLIIIYIFSQLITYSILGLPILSGRAHSAFYVDSGGLGALQTVTTGVIPVALFLLIDRFFCSSSRGIFSRLFDKFVFGFFLFSFAVSGSKGAFLPIISTFFFYRLYLYKIADSRFPILDRKIKRLSWLLLFFAGVTAVFTIIVSGEDFKSSLYVLIIRFAASGDIFAYAYTTDYLSSLQVDNYFVEVFGPIFAKLRIVDWGELPLPLGNQIWQIANDSFIPGIGPNPRHNILGFTYFGIVGGMLYSFLIGVGASFLRNYLFRRIRYDWISFVFYIMLYNFSIKLTTEIVAGVNQLFSFIFINSIVGIIVGVVLLYLRRLTRISSDNNPGMRL